MKKLAIALVLAMLLPMLAACGNGTEPPQTEPHPAGEVATTILIPSIIVDETSEGIVAQAWEARAENILQADIMRIAYTIEYHWGESRVYYSEDNVLIMRLKTWLSELRYDIIPFELFLGSASATLTFYEGDNAFPLFVGHPAANILLVEEGRIGDEDFASWKMVRIDDEAQEELLSILREMGVRRWEPIEE